MKAIPYKLRLAALSAAAAFSFGAVQSDAAVITWTPQSSNNFLLTKNLSPGTVFGASDLLLFDSQYGTLWAGPYAGAGTVPVGAVLAIGSEVHTQVIQQFNGINHNGAVLAIHGYEYTIGGETFQLLAGAIDNRSLTFTTRSANFDFKLSLYGSGVVYAGANNTVTIGTTILDDGGGRSITKKGAGTLILGETISSTNFGQNTYSGGFILEEGVVKTNANSAYSGSNITHSPFGTGTLTLRGGAIETIDTESKTYHNAVDIDGTVTLGAERSASSKGWGNMTISGNAGKQTRLLSDSTLVVHNHVSWGQNITGDYGLTKSGNGYLILSASSLTYEYSGNTNVNQGGFIVNGNLANSEVFVNNGGTLSGLGSIGRDVTVNAGGVLSPGFYAQAASSQNKTAGRLTLYGNLTMNAGSTLRFHIGATGAASDSIYTQGVVSFDNVSLDIRLTDFIADGSTYVLIQNDGFDTINGSLVYNGQTLADGSIFFVSNDSYSQAFQIFYNYTDVELFNSLVIVAVPEAGSTAMIGTGLLALLGYLGVRRRNHI